MLENLGVTWKYAGNNTKAISLYQEALAIQEELYGPNHLEVSNLKIVHNWSTLPYSFWIRFNTVKKPLIIVFEMKDNRNALAIVCSMTISGSKMAVSSLMQFDF